MPLQTGDPVLDKWGRQVVFAIKNLATGGGSTSISGSLLGDVTGLPTSNVVIKFQGRSFASTAPSSNQFIGWTGSQWAPTTITLGGDVTGAYTATTVGKLQGVTVSSTAPTTNQVLAYNGSQWAPATISSVGSRRTDMSAKRLWYKCTEASGATNLANSGAAGTLNLAITSITCGVLGFFGDNSIQFADAVSTRFAKAGSNAEAPAAQATTIWAWVRPGQISATFHRLWGRTNDGSNPIADLYIGNGDVEFQYWLVGAGANNNVSSPVGSYLSAGEDILIVATYDGVTAKLYVNGALVNSASATGSIDSSRGTNPRWQAGNRQDAATPPRMLMFDFGYDNSVFTAATINQMWRNGMGWS